MNERAAEVLQHPRAELVGRLFWEIFPEDCQEVSEREIRATLYSSEAHTFAYTDASTGRDFTVRCISNNDAELAVFLRDITEEGTSPAPDESPLRERIIGTVKDVLYLTDLPGGHTTYLNHRMDVALGYTAGYFDTLNPAQRQSLYHPEDHAILKAAQERYATLADDETLELEYRIRHNNGDWRWIRSRESVFSRGENGVPSRILGTAHDSTTEHELSEAHEVSHARYRTLVNLLSDWLFETDTNGVYTYVSPQVAITLGYDPDEILGKSPLDFMSDDVIKQMEPTYRQITSTQASYALLENVFRTKAGEIVYQETSGVPIYDKSNRWIGYRGVARNVTERKKYETLLSDASAKQSRIAETLQRSLLLTPDRLAIPGVEVVSRYEPASIDAFVGGDFWDAFRLNEDKAAFIVGDVTGKGLEAATETAEIKFLLRSYLREAPNPELALARLNKQINQRHEEGIYPPDLLVCLSVAVMDTATGTVRFAVAGMEPPFVVRNTTESSTPIHEIAEAGGPPLGTVVDWRMDRAGDTFSLNSGDFLFLYTDGLVEARGKSTGRSGLTMFGQDHLARAVHDATTLAFSTTPALPVSGICDAVLSAVRRFTGPLRRDDICLLLAQFKPESNCPAVARVTPDAQEHAMITRVDADWRYTYIGANATQHLGLNPSLMLGRSIWEVFPAYVGSDFDKLIREARETDTTTAAEIEMLPPGFLYHVTCIPLSSGEIEIQSISWHLERTTDLSRELEIALHEREAAVRERETAVRERETAVRETESSREWQKNFLTEVMSNVTEGRLRLCHSSADLPATLPELDPPVMLTTSGVLAAFRRRVEAAAEVAGIPAARVQDFMVAAGEAAMNCVVHAGGGIATFHGDPGGGLLQIKVSDSGGGIAQDMLHRATLERGYTTAGSMGLGFSLMYSSADRVYLLTGASGTTVILEQNAAPDDGLSFKLW